MPFLRAHFSTAAKGVDHLLVVDEVYEAEAGVVLLPDAVSGVRNDARDASDDAFAPIGQIVDGRQFSKAGFLSRDRVIISSSISPGT